MSFMQAPLTPPPSLSSSPDRELIPPLSTLSRSTVVQFDTERVPRTPAPTAAPQPSTRTPPEPTTLSRATVVSGMSAQPSATTLSRSTVADSAAHEPGTVRHSPSVSWCALTLTLSGSVCAAREAAPDADRPLRAQPGRHSILLHGRRHATLDSRYLSPRIALSFFFFFFLIFICCFA